MTSHIRFGLVLILMHTIQKAVIEKIESDFRMHVYGGAESWLNYKIVREPKIWM